MHLIMARHLGQVSSVLSALHFPIDNANSWSHPHFYSTQDAGGSRYIKATNCGAGVR